MKNSFKFKKVRPSSIEIDPRYQRDLDEKRAKAMARKLQPELIGVPVVSEREDGTLVVIDAQHRITACKMAGFDDLIMCEVHTGLALDEEASLFHQLNSGRSPVGAYDKYKALLVAKDPVTMKIETIVSAAGLRVAKGGTAKCTIAAVKALYTVYHRGNLPKVLSVVMSWADGDTAYLEGGLLRAFSLFLGKYPDLDTEWLVKTLAPYDAGRIIAKLQRARGAYNDTSPVLAACLTFRDIYNKGRSAKSRLPPPDVFEEERQQARASASVRTPPRHARNARYANGVAAH